MTTACLASRATRFDRQSTPASVDMRQSSDAPRQLWRFPKRSASDLQTYTFSSLADLIAARAVLPNDNYQAHSRSRCLSDQSLFLAASHPYPRGSSQRPASVRTQICLALRILDTSHCSGSDNAPSSVPKIHKLGFARYASNGRAQSFETDLSMKLNKSGRDHFAHETVETRMSSRNAGMFFQSCSYAYMEYILSAINKARVRGVLRPVQGLTARRLRERAACLKDA